MTDESEHINRRSKLLSMFRYNRSFPPLVVGSRKHQCDVFYIFCTHCARYLTNNSRPTPKMPYRWAHIPISLSTNLLPVFSKQLVSLRDSLAVRNDCPPFQKNFRIRHPSSLSLPFFRQLICPALLLLDPFLHSFWRLALRQFLPRNRIAFFSASFFPPHKL